MSKEDGKKGKQVRVEEELEGEIEISQDVNVSFLLDTNYKNGYQVFLNLNEIYHFSRRKNIQFINNNSLLQTTVMALKRMTMKHTPTLENLTSTISCVSL